MKIELNFNNDECENTYIESDDYDTILLQLKNIFVRYDAINNWVIDVKVVN